MSHTKPRIFCFDDERENLDLLRAWLEMIDCEVETYHVQSLADKDHLMHRLQTEWWHLVIADIALLGHDIQDRYGLDIILSCDPIVPKIILTAYSERPHQDLVAILTQRPGHQLPFVTDFISKNEPNVRAKIMASLQRILQSNGTYRINHDLQIETGDAFFHQVAGNIRTPSQSRTEDVQEIEDLCRKLFPIHQRVAIQTLRPQPIEGVFLLAQATRQNGLHETTLIHCGHRQTIQKIYHNEQTYLNLAPHIAKISGFAETLHYAGILYRFNGSPEQFETFDHLIFQVDAERLTKLLDKLFTQVLQPLYRARHSRQVTETFAQHYRRLLRLDEQKESLPRLTRRLLSEHSLVARGQNQERFQLLLPVSPPDAQGNRHRRVDLHDPSRLIYDGDHLFILDDPAPHGITYGQLRGNSIFIDPANQIWLAGSSQIDFGFLLEDFVSLEVVIFINSLYEIDQKTDDTEILTAMRAWITPNSLESTIPIRANLNPVLTKALELCEIIRHKACGLHQLDIRYYYGGLLFHLAHEILLAKRPWSGTEPRHLSHTALATALLGDRLQQWPKWSLALTIQGGLVIDGKKVFVPLKDEWISLTPTLLDLLKLFLHHPHRTLSAEDISLAGWEGNTTNNNIAQQVKRLRDLIETNPEKPFYLHTIQGFGYQYRPDGQEITIPLL